MEFIFLSRIKKKLRFLFLPTFWEAYSITTIIPYLFFKQKLAISAQAMPAEVMVAHTL